MRMSDGKHCSVVAIDGPAGSGKSTVARRIAENMGLIYIDTGAMYRALTYFAIRDGVSLQREERLSVLAERFDIQFVKNEGSPRVVANREDVTEQIRAPGLTKQVRYVASCARVRKRMVFLQRRMGQRKGGVLEGRDIGTVVFPHADYKIYLDADVDVRANRRYLELIGKGQQTTFEEVRKELCARDDADIHRNVGPLKVAQDAVIVDTSLLTIENVVDTISRFISCRQKTLKKF